jgi:hypothetical protein
MDNRARAHQATGNQELDHQATASPVRVLQATASQELDHPAMGNPAPVLQAGLALHPDNRVFSQFPTAQPLNRSPRTALPLNQSPRTAQPRNLVLPTPAARARANQPSNPAPLQAMEARHAATVPQSRNNHRRQKVTAIFLS